MRLSQSIVFAILAASTLAETALFAQQSPQSIDPLVRIVDLSVGETQQVTLSDGKSVKVTLQSLQEQRDTVSRAVRRAEVSVLIDGIPAELVAATYHLPITVGTVQIDCSVTSGYNSNGRPESWGLDKDARLRLWPAGSPLIRPGTFGYPAKQRWFATMTQMANEPTYVDGGDDPFRETIYYHSGLDIGGTEGRVEVVAATDGLVVASGNDVLPEHREDTPIAERYDVVYLLDARGWYYRYSHLKEIDDAIRPGRIISLGDRIGLLGKEGGSGGWTHLHFEAKSRQPSGKWGTQAGYAFLWQAYIAEHSPSVVAVARPHHFLATGETASLDASKSWGREGDKLDYEWTMHDGSIRRGPKVDRRYEASGTYSEIVKVTNTAGEISYDFAVVQVVDRGSKQLPPTVHPTYFPTFDIHPGDPVHFTVRSFRTTKPGETWDFGDGSDPVTVTSDGNARMHDANGYAVTTHRYTEPGDYLVRVESTNAHGLKATGHLHVKVEYEKGSGTN